MGFRKAFRTIRANILNPRWIFARFALRKIKKESHNLSDKEYIETMFRIRVGYKLDLSNPITFNEKMNFLKLFNRKNQYTLMVDKHAVKAYVSDLIGEEYIAKELGVYNRAEDIDVSMLPERFVLKTTHGCGGMIIVKNKGDFDINQAVRTLNPSLESNYYYWCREWPYKNVKPRIIAEEFLKDDNYDVLPVYKFFCFDGQPFLLQGIKNDKHENETIDYFDMSWNNLHIRQNFPNSRSPLKKPASFEKMIEFCKAMTKGIPFVRCDFYDVNGHPYFSEFTFYSDAGFEKFHPKKWDRILGDKIDLTNCANDDN